MHDHCLRFVFLLFHFSPRNYLDSNYRKFSTDEHNKHLVYVTCLQRLTKGVQLRCNPTLFNGGLYWATEVIFIDFLWRESSLSLVKYQLFDVDQLVNKSYHTQHKQWGPKSTTGKHIQVKPKDTRSTQYVKYTQVPNKKKANQLYKLVYLPRKKKNLNVSLTFHFMHIYFFFTFCVLKKLLVLSPDFPRSALS